MGGRRRERETKDGDAGLDTKQKGDRGESMQTGNRLGHSMKIKQKLKNAKNGTSNHSPRRKKGKNLKIDSHAGQALDNED